MAWRWLSRRRSTTVRPARAMPASTVMPASATATLSSSSNWPTVNSTSESEA